MSDYYGRPTLEDWLQIEVFESDSPLPRSTVAAFEPYRERVEANIEAWMETDDGDGNPTSWRGWGRGFYAIDTDDETFDHLVKCHRDVMGAPPT